MKFLSDLLVQGDGNEIFLKSADHNISRIIPRGTGANLDKGLFSLFDTGTEDVRIDTAGVSWFNGGNVGIGTTSPEGKLNIEAAAESAIPALGANTTFLKISNSGGAYGTMIGQLSTGDGYIQSQRFDGGNSVYNLLLQKNGGKVGIGTTSPNEKLTVAGNIHAYAPSGINAGLFASTAAGATSIAIRSSGVTFFNAGNVGIGTTSPYGRLNVIPSSNPTTSTAANQISVGESSGNAQYNLRLGYFLEGGAYKGSIQSISGNTPNTLVLNGDGGGVGIGTTNPGTKLHVKESTANILIGADDTYGANYSAIGFGGLSNGHNRIFAGYNGSSVYDDMYYAAGTGKGHQFRTNGSGGTKVIITSAGNVGIGTTAPEKKLHIIGTSSDTAGAGLFAIEGDAGNVSWVFRSTDTGDNLAIDREYGGAGSYYNTLTLQRSTGNVGIGTTAPSYGLDVNHNAARIGSSAQTTTSLYLTATNTAGAPAVATQIIMQGYEGRAKGTFYTDSGNDGEWFNGIPYNGSHNYWQVGFDETGGQAEYRANAKLTIRDNGNVGIGTNSPGSPLDVKSNSASSADSGIRLIANGSTDIIAAIGEKSTNGARFHLYDGGTAKVSFYSDGTANYIAAGNVGIGTTAPGYKLDVSGDFRVKDGSSAIAFNEYSDGATIWLDGSNGDFAGGDYFNISAYGTTDLAFGYGASTKITMKSDGKLGIGTTSPTRPLSVEGTAYVRDDFAVTVTAPGTNLQKDSQLYLQSKGNQSGTIRSSQWYFQTESDSIYGNSGLSISKKYDGGSTLEYLRITSGGDVGIGTTAPARKLHVSKTGNGNIALFTNTTDADLNINLTSGVTMLTPSTALLAFGTSNAEKMRIIGNGNVGIGTTSPSSILDVQNVPSGGSGTILNVGLDASNPVRAKIHTESYNGAFSLYDSGSNEDVKITTSGNSYFNGGNVGIGTTSPGSESNLSLGAKSASEGGHLTLFKGTSNTHATHIDNYADSFRIMKGTDASSSTVQFSLAHATGNAAFAGDVSLVDSKKLILGAGSDLKIYHNSTDSVIENSAGDLYITNKADDKDIVFRTDDGSGGYATYFYLDGSGAITRVSRNFRADDSVALQVGSNGDAGFFHDGTNTSISNDTGDLIIQNNANDKDIVFKSDDGSGGVATYFFLDGGSADGTNLYTVFPDSSRLLFGTGEDLQIYHDGSNSYIREVGTGNLIIQGSSRIELKAANDEKYLRAIVNGAVSLYYDDAEKLATTSTGVEVTGKITNLTAGTGNLDAVNVQQLNNATTGTLIYKGTWSAAPTTTSVLDGAVSSTGTIVIDAVNPGISVGATITGTGISGTVTVSNIAADGITIAISSSQTIADGTTLTFTTVGGTPDLSQASRKVTGHYYICETAGAATPNGASTTPNEWAVGDWATFSDLTTDAWQKIDNSSVLSGAGTGGKVPVWSGTGTSVTLADAPITVSGNNAAFAGDITSTGLTVDYTGNRTGDAGILVTNDGSDWGVKVDKDGTTDYGILSQTDGDNAIVVRNAAGTTNIQLQGDGDATFAGIVGVGSTGVYAGTNAALNLPGKGIALKNDKAGSNNNWSYINNTATAGSSNINFATGQASSALTLAHNGNATFAGSIYANTIYSATNSAYYIDVNSTGVGLNTAGGATFAGNITFGDSHTIGDDGDDNLVIASSASENIIIDSADDIVLDAAGNDVLFKDAGTHVGTINMSSSNLTIESSVSDKDIIFKGRDGTSTITALTLDMSNGGSATFIDDIDFGGKITQTGTGTNTFAGNITGTSAQFIDTTNPDGGGGAGEGGSLTVEGRRDGTANLISLRARDASAPTVALPDGQGGLIRWQGFDGTDFAQMGAISVVADGQAVANSDAPSKMIFYTTPDGSDALTTALTLDKSQNATFAGNVTLSNTAPILYLANTTSSTGKTWRLSSAANGNAYITQDGVIDAITLSHTSGNATFAGTVATGNMTISGQEIDVSSGDLTLDVAGDIVLDADGGDVNLSDGGTFIGRLGLENGDLNIASAQQDYDIKLKGNDGGSIITALHLDMSAAGAATFSGDVTVGALTSGATAQLIVNHEGGSTAVASFKSRTNRAQVSVADNDTTGYLVAEASVFGIGRTGSLSANNININASNNVGIGTTDPKSKLHVNGGIQMSNDTAAASADKVGTMRYRTDTEYVEVNGTELVTNGDFSGGSQDWTKESGWSIASGKASYDASSATNALYQSIGLTTGSVYRLSFTVVNYTSGSFKGHLSNGNVTAATDAISANGDYSFNITATGALVLFRNVTSFNGSIDNVSVIEVTAEDASYADMCMQTGASTYEWVNIVRNTY
jgi:hypothetical protein